MQILAVHKNRILHVIPFLYMRTIHEAAAMYADVLLHREYFLQISQR